MLLAWLSLSEEKVSSMTPDCLEKDTLATQLQEAQVGQPINTSQIYCSLLSFLRTYHMLKL